MNIIHIDTSNNQNIKIVLKTDKKEYVEESVASREKAQAALPLISKVLASAGLTPSDIHEIDVETGPGSFTGLRVGVAIANAFSFGALVKINGKELGEIESPNY